MPPVSGLYRLYDEGTPRRVLQDKVASKYPDRIESFFEDVGAALNIQPESASGAFYGFLRGDRPLPSTHERAYIELLRVSPALLRHIDEEVSGTTPAPSGRDRLRRAEDELRALRREFDDFVKAATERLAALEAVPVPAKRRSGRPSSIQRR